MSVASLSTRSTVVTLDELVEAGFTTEEIEQLSALKAAYPFVEYVESANHWQRLLFLKWRYENGDLQRS